MLAAAAVVRGHRARALDAEHLVELEQVVVGASRSPSPGQAPEASGRRPEARHPYRSTARRSSRPARSISSPALTLRVAVNRVSGVAVGVGGYVANSKTSYGTANPTAQITIRVPSDQFENAITRLDALPDVKVLGESENGTDVTTQLTDLNAQLAAATGGAMRCSSCCRERVGRRHPVGRKIG